MTAVTAASLAFAGSVYADEGTFTVALDSDIVALDPIYAYDFTTNPVIDQITEGLLLFDENNQLVPFLAKSWEVVDDVTYVYQIRDDINFSDGTPMTMDDVLFSINRNLDPDAGSYLNWLFDAVESIEQTGDWELTVKLSEPSVNWQYVLATTAGHVISKAYYEEHELDFGTPEGGIIGTGPYVYDSWTSGQEIVLTKNENYWDKDIDLLMDTIVYKIIPEDTTRVIALQTGQADFTPNTPIDMLDTLRDTDGLVVKEVETASVTYVAMNTARAPFDDVNVRKAVTAAIDLATIKENIVGDAGDLGGFLPNNNSIFAAALEDWEAYEEQAEYITYDLDAAKEYLAASAYPDGFSCTMILPEHSLRYSVCLYMQEALKELNIDMELVKVSMDEHTAYQMGQILDENGDRDYDMLIGGWGADYPDMAGNIEPLLAGYNTGDGGSNASMYANDEVDALLRQSSQITDPKERTKLLTQVMDIVNQDCPYLFVFYPGWQFTYQDKFTGVIMNSSWDWNLLFKDLRYAE